MIDGVLGEVQLPRGGPEHSHVFGGVQVRARGTHPVGVGEVWWQVVDVVMFNDPRIVTVHQAVVTTTQHCSQIDICWAALFPRPFMMTVATLRWLVTTREHTSAVAQHHCFALRRGEQAHTATQIERHTSRIDHDRLHVCITDQRGSSDRVETVTTDSVHSDRDTMTINSDRQDRFDHR